jgi:hypothetical protein
MIIQYRETSETVEIHSQTHTVCTHDVESGWECSCSDCRCETVINVNAGYAYDDDNDYKVLFTVNPGQHSGRASGSLTPDAARALAAALCFAANDAETLNREYGS